MENGSFQSLTDSQTLSQDCARFYLRGKVQSVFRRLRLHWHRAPLVVLEGADTKYRTSFTESLKASQGTFAPRVHFKKARFHGLWCQSSGLFQVFPEGVALLSGLQGDFMTDCLWSFRVKSAILKKEETVKNLRGQYEVS